MTNFTHLHVHSQYSVLDGMSKIPDLVNRCRKTGMNSIALTDHGNMYGIKELLDYCKKINKAPAGALKDCEDNLKKAQKTAAELPKLEAEEKACKDKAEKVSLHKKIEEARQAEKQIPLYEAELPKLKQQADEYMPFKPIVGVEAYCARRSRHSKDKNVKELSAEGREFIVDRSGWHLILLAKNKTGYMNLCKIVSLSFLEGFYDRPRIDKELLQQYHEGLIVCSACLGGELPQLIMRGKVEEAEKSIRWFKSIFGDDYYIELQRHQTDKPGGDTNTYQRQKEVNPVLIELARKTDTKIICTNDVHFVEEEHSEAHDRLICISTGVYLDDIKRLHYTKQEWLKSPEEMAKIFADLPEALENTQEIVDKIETYSIDTDPIMPKFPIPESFGTEEEYRQKYTPEDLFNEFTRNEKGEVVLKQEDAEKKIQKLGGYDRLYRIKFEADYLAKLTWDGAHERYGDVLTDEQKDRITFELHVMKTMGFPGYFLIVMDYIRAAREELGVSVGPGRGSAAGSVVAYCLKITDVDPLKYDLLFERFLNPDRISLPDIDVDFDDEGRERVLDWVSEKYGKTHVAHIIIYGTMASKSAIADVGRVQQVPLKTVKEIKDLIPKKFPDSLKDEKGKVPKVNLHNCYKYVSELRQQLNSDDRNISSMLHYAEELEDTVRQVGVHACGVIIGADDLTKFAPLSTIYDKKLKQDIIVTQYDGHYVESVGLIKMDFLGLKTLTILKEAVANVKKSKNIDIDIDHIPVDDALTYKLFQEGKTIATFQFESSGMQMYLKDLKPTVLTDLIAMNALYRPGPMDYIPQFIARKQGREPIVYDLPCMEKYLADTYGVTVYQEQVMLLSREIAGFTRGESDQLRKAMGKKIKAMLDELHPKFIEGGRNKGYDTAILEKIWSDWEAFASYAFNKSHATCYAWIAYQTGYMKAHYPAEFMAANLTVEKADITKVSKFMDECKAMNIRVLEPDVNESGLNFTVNQKGDIRFGLGGIKGVGENAVQAIIEEREKHGRYKDIYDFVERINLSACNRKTMESLTIAGAFDCFEDTYREQLLGCNSKGEGVLDMLIRYGNKYQVDKQATTNSLFGDFSSEMGIDIQKPELPFVERMSAIERLNKEKDLIGMYLSAHPLDKYQFELENLCNITAKELAEFEAIRTAEKRTNAVNNTNDETEEDDDNNNVIRTSPNDWLKEKENQIFTFGGIITRSEVATSMKTNKQYGKYQLEDYSGSYTFFLFNEDYEIYHTRLSTNNFVYITGVLQQYGAQRQYFKPKAVEQANYELKIQHIEHLDNVQTQSIESVTLLLPVNRITHDFSQELIRQCNENKGDILLKIQVFDEMRDNVVNLICPHYPISITPSFYQFLRERIQENGVKYIINTRNG